MGPDTKTKIGRARGRYFLLNEDVNIDEFFNFNDDEKEEDKDTKEKELNVKEKDVPSNETEETLKDEETPITKLVSLPSTPDEEVDSSENKRTQVENELDDFFDFDEPPPPTAKRPRKASIDTIEKRQKPDDNTLLLELKSLDLSHTMTKTPSGVSVTLDLSTCTLFLDITKIESYPRISLSNITVSSADKATALKLLVMERGNYGSVTEIVNVARGIVKEL